MLKKNSSQTAKDFVLENVSISSGYLISGAEINITDVVTDIDIYEHLDKPYITGTVTFLDTENIYSAINFYGIEKLSLSVRLPEAEFPTIRKNFYIDKVVNSIRSSDVQPTIVLHIVEDIGYLSEFINVNKSYTGKGYKIISNILKEYLGKELSKPNNSPIFEETQDIQPIMQVMVPNMRPLKAADWIKDRITGEYATPFYLFSTLVNDKMHLLSLHKMLDRLPINSKPFVYSQGQTNSGSSINDQMYVIEKYNTPNTEDLVKLNSKGFVNSVFAFHDVTTNRTQYAGQRQSNHGSDKNQWTAFDMFGTRAIDGRALGRSSTVNGNINIASVYPVLSKLPAKGNQQEELLHLRRESKVVSNIVSTEQYSSEVYGLQEGRTEQQLTEMVDSKAFRNWSVNTTLDFTMSGRYFLYGDYHRTVGNKVQLAFMVIDRSSISVKDEKTSGEYLIYSARHTFTREGYVVNLTGVKLADNVSTPITYRAIQ
jgi:hypothetical protein